MAERPEFAAVAGPLRRELLVHCYRMLGSVHDAEDQVQETFLRGWRAYDRFEGRSSVRVWLYQIATNACLRALEQAGRRALPADLSEAVTGEPALPLAESSVLWLQPLPGDPADVVAERDQVRLAMVAALQHLPPRQRAALLLRDVVGLPAVEVAAVLGTTVAAANSALQRARASLAQGPGEARPVDPARLARYVAAMHDADLGALAAVLVEDVTLEMPPYEAWFRGRDGVLAFLGARILDVPGRLRLVPVTANGQPAFGVYLDGHAHAINLVEGGIARLHFFLDPALFAAFGLPPMSFGDRADLYR